MYIVNLESGDSKPVEITVPGDRPSLRRKRVDAASFIRSADVSPSGKRVVLEARGDIWTAPAKNGSPRNLTRSNGSAERFPTWSPDGRWIAYFSDATGEYELYLTQSDGRGETKQVTKDGSCYRYPGNWSPDSKHLTFSDKTGALFVVTIETGDVKEVDSDPMAEQIDSNWSHDSKWLCYAKSTDSRVPSSNVWVYKVDDGTRRQISTGYFSDSSPVFDRKGDYIYFSSNRKFSGPKYDDMGTTFIYSGTEVLLAMPLRADIEHPYLEKSDEEEWEEDKKEDEEGKDKKDGEDTDEDKDESDGEKSDDDESDDEEGDEEEDEEGDDDSDEGDEEEDEEGEDEDDSDEDEMDEGDESDEPSDPITGVWTLELQNNIIPEGERTVTLTLELADGTVTGSVTTPDGEVIELSGTFDAKTGKLELSLIHI